MSERQRHRPAYRPYHVDRQERRPLPDKTVELIRSAVEYAIDCAEHSGQNVDVELLHGSRTLEMTVHGEKLLDVICMPTSYPCVVERYEDGRVAGITHPTVRVHPPPDGRFRALWSEEPYKCNFIFCGSVYDGVVIGRGREAIERGGSVEYD